MTTVTAKPLNPRQSAFVAEYILNGGNATQAAASAGYPPSNARFQASRMLATAHIRQQIALRQTKITVEANYSIADWRRDLLADIGRARDAGNWSAVMGGHQLMGRHVGALADARHGSPVEDAFWRRLGELAAGEAAKRLGGGAAGETGARALEEGGAG